MPFGKHIRKPQVCAYICIRRYSDLKGMETYLSMICNIMFLILGNRSVPITDIILPMIFVSKLLQVQLDEWQTIPRRIISGIICILETVF